MKTIKIKFQEDSNGRGWVAWMGADREWQPVVGCEDPATPPTVEEACLCDPISVLFPWDYDGVEIVD